MNDDAVEHRKERVHRGVHDQVRESSRPATDQVTVP
jgi:hypothetical protein